MVSTYQDQNEPESPAPTQMLRYKSTNHWANDLVSLSVRHDG